MAGSLAPYLTEGKASGPLSYTRNVIYKGYNDISGAQQPEERCYVTLDFGFQQFLQKGLCKQKTM